MGQMVPPKSGNPNPWFRNIKSGRPFYRGHRSTDYSLQTAIGIANFSANRATLWLTKPMKREALLRRMEIRDTRPFIESGPLH